MRGAQRFIDCSKSPPIGPSPRARGAVFLTCNATPLVSLFWTHINPYGRFDLDMDKRLDPAVCDPSIQAAAYPGDLPFTVNAWSSYK